MWSNTIPKYLNEVKDLNTLADIYALTYKTFPREKKQLPDSYVLSTFMNWFETKTSDANVLMALPILIKVYHNIYTNHNTIKQKISRVRRVIEAHQSKAVYLKSRHDTYFNFDLAQRTADKEKYTRSVDAKNKNKLQINQTEVLAKMRELIRSKNVYDRAVSMLLATGARPLGLLVKNTYKVIIVSMIKNPIFLYKT